MKLSFFGRRFFAPRYFGSRYFGVQAAFAVPTLAAGHLVVVGPESRSAFVPALLRNVSAETANRLVVATEASRETG